jgi:hypothetical protein
VPEVRIERTSARLQLAAKTTSATQALFWWGDVESNYSRLKNCFTDSLLEPLALPPRILVLVEGVEPSTNQLSADALTVRTH